MAYFEGEIPVVTTGTNGGFGNGFGDSAWQVLPLYRVTYIEKLRY